MTSATPGAAASVAVVGSGPSGLYLVQALLAGRRDIAIDVFERERTPLGLLRYGVAPDHLKIRSMEDRLLPPLDDPRVRWHGGVTVGEDLTREQLADAYDAVVYATGAPLPTTLDVPGADLRGVTYAVDVIDWYNAKPGAEAFLPHTAAERILVIGGGNVALDVGRMLLRERQDLLSSDMPDDLLHHFDSSAARHVTIAIRRDYLSTRFNAKELLEIAHLPGVSVVADHGGPPPSEPDSPASRVLASLPVEHSEARRRITFMFDTSLRRVEQTSAGSLIAVLQRPATEDSIGVDLVVGAIGYRNALPWQRDGLDTTDRLRENEHLVGWAATGPQGLLAAARASAAAVAAEVLARLSTSSTTSSAPARLRRDGHVSGADWARHDQREREAGLARGARRVKIRPYGA